MWLKAVSRYDTICVYGYNNIIIVNHPQGCKYNVARLRKWKNSKDLVKPSKAMSEYLKKTKSNNEVTNKANKTNIFNSDLILLQTQLMVCTE